MAILETAYKGKCEEKGCLVIPSLVESLKAADVKGSPVKHVSLRGSSKELFESRVSYDQLAAISETLVGQHVHHLDLSYNTIDDAGATALGGMLRQSAVKSVNLQGNEIGAAGVAALVEAFVAFQKGSETGEGVQELNISGNPLGNAGAEVLASLLPTSRSLLVLKAAHCDMDLRGLIHLTNALTSSDSSLEVLSLEDVRQLGHQQEHAKHLANMLASNSRLRELYIGKMLTRDVGCATLIQYGLLRNNTLIKLDLRCNQITLESGPILARLLTENETLTSLNLASNRLGDKGMAAIATVLPENTSLSHLDLSSNGAGDAGLISLAQAMQSAYLVGLHIDGNSFSRFSGQSLKSMVAHRYRRGEFVLLDVVLQEVDGIIHVATNNQM